MPSHSRSSVPEAKREKVVLMLTDSYLTHPKQDAELRTAETRRITRAVFGRNYTDRDLGSVRAIRANYTRGNYGTPATLKRRRKAELSR